MCFFFQAEDGIRDLTVTGVQTCALPICCVMSIGRDQRERGRERGPRGAIRGGRDEYGGQRTARQRFAPVPFRQERRAGHVPVAVLVVRDVVAGELHPGRRRDSDWPSEIERQRRRGRADGPHRPPPPPPPPAPPRPPPPPAAPLPPRAR